MRIHTFQEMLIEYRIAELQTDDDDSRKEMLLGYQYSVIVEGGFMEFDSLNKLIEANIGKESINRLVYDKTDYNYGFTEYFFADELQARAVAKAVPLIYTIYPHSYPPNETAKSNGYNDQIVYDPTDKHAIVINLEND